MFRSFIRENRFLIVSALFSLAAIGGLLFAHGTPKAAEQAKAVLVLETPQCKVYELSGVGNSQYKSILAESKVHGFHCSVSQP